MPTVTATAIMNAVDLAGRVWGAPVASALLTAAMKKLAGELTPEDRAQLEGNYAEGLAARADAFERSQR